jgi:rhodanese-related sulfurtransferase
VHELPSALALSPDDFEETFGFKKPSPDTRLVFFCRSGARSSGAVELARAAGYTKYAHDIASGSPD